MSSDSGIAVKPVEKSEIDELDAEFLTDPDILADFLWRCQDNVTKKQVEAWILLQAGKKKCKTETRGILKEIQKSNETNGNITDFQYGNATELVCGSWTADRRGIRQLGDKGLMEACNNAVLPVRWLRNMETGNFLAEIATCVCGHWQKFVVEKAVIANSSRIVQLVNKGVQTNSEMAKHLVRYFSDIEKNNEIPTVSSSSKMGWHEVEANESNRDLFLPYDIRELEFDAGERFSNVYGAIRQKGSADEWLSMAREVRATGRYEPMVYLAASFASVLLKKVGILPFMVNVWAKTGKGKTVAEMLATSVWADPTSGVYMVDAYATSTSVEARLDFLDDLPLVLDDMSKSGARGLEQLTDLIYLISSGQGKGRSNVDLGVRRPNTWHNVTITSMERPLASDEMRGGAINRVLDFEMDSAALFDGTSGNRVATIARANYGFAGMVFVQAVKHMGWNRIKEMWNDACKRVREEAKRQDSQKEDKQVGPLALMLVADEIAEMAIFQDGKRLDLKKCVSMLKGVDDTDEGKRAYEFIMSYAAENYAAFHAEEYEDYRGKICGFWGKDEVLYIYPNAFQKICDEGGFSKKAFCSWAKEERLLKHDSNRLTASMRYPSKKPPAGSFNALIQKERKKDNFYGIRYREMDGDDFKPIEKSDLFK